MISIQEGYGSKIRENMGEIPERYDLDEEKETSLPFLFKVVKVKETLKEVIKVSPLFLGGATCASVARQRAR